jgi:hypothetical protein
MFIAPEHLERVRYAAQIHAPAVSAYLAANGACAQLVGYRRVGLKFELDTAALAASFEGPGVEGARDEAVSIIIVYDAPGE